MIVYTARKDILNESKALIIWPKELQLISRMTEKQARKLAIIYSENQDKYGVSQPLEEAGIRNHLEKEFASHYAMHKYHEVGHGQGSLMSPKATINFH